ncbi:hypothetical protein DES40_2530 [Litorimonas taeanensis]|uniref:Uncharacterized protein n=1 Tax=Litorimonas taeanensis TaxID=568099 RepID=A0A420WFI7_9PROT|nr:hypothetical protein [Litorimonas taeanensis]RKQ69725.1 hypothetical protein DES40_2530 [Litorimonas taeanensis]
MKNKTYRNLLADVLDSLEGIKAAILQTSIDEVRRVRVNSTRALKGLVYVGATSSTLGIVTLFGTAGTGTAISTLSGAALTSSQLAFLGFGSMATGVVVLGAIGFATCQAVGWMYKTTVYGKPRKFKTLSDNEVSILSMIDSLVAPLADALETTSENHAYSREDIFLYAFDGLAPLQDLLEEEFGSNVFIDEKVVQDVNNSIKLSLASRAALKRRFWGLVQAVERITNRALNDVMTRLEAGVAPASSPVHNLVVKALRQSVAPQEVSDLKLADCVRRFDRQKNETVKGQAKLILLKQLEQLKQPHALEKVEGAVIVTVDGVSKTIGTHGKKLIKTSTEKMRPAVGVFKDEMAQPRWDRVRDHNLLKPEGRLATAVTSAAPKIQNLTGNAKGLGRKVIGDFWRKTKIARDKLEDAAATNVLEYNSETSYSEPQSRLASVVIAVCVERLMSNRLRYWTLEEDLVLQALRLSIPDLSEADITELSSYLRNSDPAQMRGVLATTKGKYHELIVKQAENMDGDEVSARLFEDLNHPGSDIEFIVDGQVIEEVQLKAVVSEALIIEHQSKYPDITILATEEAASRVDGVESSGFSNAQLQADVEERLKELEGDGTLDNMGDAFVVSALSLAALNAKKIAKGDVSADDLRTSANDIAAGLTTSILLDMIF